MTEKDFQKSISDIQEVQANFNERKYAETRAELIRNVTNLIIAVYQYEFNPDPIDENKIYILSHVPAEGFGSDSYDEYPSLSVRFESRSLDATGQTTESIVFYLPVSTEFALLDNASDDSSEKIEALMNEKPKSVVVQNSKDSELFKIIQDDALGGVINLGIDRERFDDQEKIDAALEEFLRAITDTKIEDIPILGAGNPTDDWLHILSGDREVEKLHKFARDLANFDLVPQKNI